jgi:hypothetical protein
VLGERAAARYVQVLGKPGNTAQHLQRLDVKVGPLGPPLADQAIDLVGELGAARGGRVVRFRVRESFHDDQVYLLDVKRPRLVEITRYQDS